MADVDPFVSESLVAAIGMEPFVMGTFRVVHRYQVERALGMSGEIDRRLARFLRRAEPEPAAELPPFNFREVVDALAEEPKPADAEAITAGFYSPDMGLAVQLEVQRIRTHLAAKVPKRVRDSLAGPEVTDPPGSEVARFRRLWAIACDPLSVLVDLNEFALSWDQAAGFAELYPRVSARAKVAVNEQIAEVSAARPGWQLFRRKEQLLRVLLGLPPLSADVGRDMQQVYAADAQPQLPRGRATGPNKPQPASDQSTSAQRIEQG